MKLQASIDDYQTEVRISDEGARAFAAVDGRSYELDVRYSDPGHYLLISDATVFDCRVDVKPESGKPVDVFVGTKHYAVALTDPKRLRGATIASAHADEAARIIAPMPGKVVRVLVDAGARVEPGEGIVVVEAMKMQNEMKSPRAGRVLAISAKEGATVTAGEVLATIG